MRGVKAEGGWAVVCTEEVEIHHSSEHSPGIEGRLWDDRDIPVLARMTEKGACPWQPSRDRAGLRRGDNRQPLQPGNSDGTVAHAGERL